MKKLIWSLSLLLASLMARSECNEVANHHGNMIHEVKEGDIANLTCPSNDDYHRFIFWLRVGADNSLLVIGPGQEINRTKYTLEVLSGDLVIRFVTKEEEGPYICVSEALKNSIIYIKPVHLVVKKDWEEVWETDYETNLFRGWIAFIVIGVLLACAYMTFRYRRRSSSSRFRNIPDEEGQEDNSAGVELTPASRNFQENGEAETSVVDTDFPKAFNAMYRPMGGVEARL